MFSFYDSNYLCCIQLCLVFLIHSCLYWPTVQPHRISTSGGIFILGLGMFFAKRINLFHSINQVCMTSAIRKREETTATRDAFASTHYTCLKLLLGACAYSKQQEYVVLLTTVCELTSPLIKKVSNKPYYRYKPWWQNFKV
jgi:hypothetical protein